MQNGVDADNLSTECTNTFFILHIDKHFVHEPLLRPCFNTCIDNSALVIVYSSTVHTHLSVKATVNTV